MDLITSRVTIVTPGHIRVTERFIISVLKCGELHECGGGFRIAFLGLCLPFGFSRCALGCSVRVMLEFTLAIRTATPNPCPAMINVMLW